MHTLRNLIKTAIAMTLHYSLPIFAMAQPGFGDDVDDVPVDGGMSLLVAAGLGYGIRRMRSTAHRKSITKQ